MEVWLYLSDVGMAVDFNDYSTILATRCAWLFSFLLDEQYSVSVIA